MLESKANELKEPSDPLCIDDLHQSLKIDDEEEKKLSHVSKEAFVICGEIKEKEEEGKVEEEKASDDDSELNLQSGIADLFQDPDYQRRLV